MFFNDGKNKIGHWRLGVWGKKVKKPYVWKKKGRLLADMTKISSKTDQNWEWAFWMKLGEGILNT